MEHAAKAAFRILDEDNSGSIAPLELRQLLTRLGMAVSDDDLEQIVEELDNDHDGSIDEDEFMDWVRSKSERKELDLTDPNAVKQFTAEVFAMVDRDGDGNVTTEELYDTLSILIPDIDVSDVREIFADMDEDRNGSVSREEFAATIKGHAAYI
jgi:calmodulin